MPRIWIDVESLFQYAAAASRPSGIQRLELELGQALAGAARAAGRVGFVRHARGGDGLLRVSAAAVAALHARLSAAEHDGGGTTAVETGAATVMVGAGAGAGADDAVWARRLLYRLPPDLRGPVGGVARHGIAALREAANLRRPLSARLRRGGRGQGVGATVGAIGDAGAEAGFAEAVRPGDVLLMLGAAWLKPDAGAFAAALRQRHGLRLGVLVYDVIPAARPEWSGRAVAAQFRNWLRTLLPQADWVFTISTASARDLARVAARERVALRDPPIVLPVGTGFRVRGSGLPPAGTPAGLPGRLRDGGDYVLAVGTLDPRKNQALLLRVWRRLLDELAFDAVPLLVLAGTVGPMAEDLLRQLRNADWLGSKVMLVREPGDAVVEALYRGCLFSVFPSFYEGWGLPVTESLGFGRPCVCSNASSLPEAGGALARYFDPENGEDAYQSIRTAIVDREGTAAWARRVRSEFRPVAWAAAADTVLDALDGVSGTSATVD